MSSVQRSWLTVWSGAVCLFGLVLTGAAFEATDGPSRALLTIMGPSAPDLDAPLRFAVGLMGAVTLGWGMTVYVLLRAIDALQPAQARPIWTLLTAAILIWYVVDGAISIATGFALNAASNTVFLIAYLVPIFGSGAMRGDGATTRPRPA